MTVPSSNYSNQNERWRDQMARMADYTVPSISSKSGSIAASNTYGSAVQLLGRGCALIVVAGTFAATVFAQLSLSTATSPGTWYDIKSFAAATIQVIEPLVACSARVGVKTGGYTSGTVSWAIKTGGRP